MPPLRAGFTRRRSDGAMILSEGAIYDRYVVEAPLGQGAMAVVYKVRHRDLGSLHALKVLTIRDRGVRERFQREGMVQSQLRHPNVVAVTDTIDVDGRPGLVMELVDGPPLDRLLAARRPTLAQADQIARGILAGVGAAHAFGTVHRDLKPANILLQVVPTGPVPKVSDFGVAKVLGSTKRQTRSGTGLGTPAYMAPEQMRDASTVDPRADVFSLGAILYELVTGQMAFEGDDLLEILQQVATGTCRPPRELVPALPDRMVEAIDAALRKGPADRPADVNALLALWTAGTPEPTSPWDGEAITLLRSVSETHRAQRVITPRSHELQPQSPIARMTTALLRRDELTRPETPGGTRRWVVLLAITTVLALVLLAGLVTAVVVGVTAAAWWLTG